MKSNFVFCYHALSERWKAPLSAVPQTFERQISLLLSRGYRGVTFSELTTAPRNAGVFAVTFDDAFHSVYALAAPRLRRLGVPATIFVPTAYVENETPLAWAGTAHWLDTPAAPELAPMSWEQLREVRAEGWEIGSHTVSHPHLPQLSDAELHEELVDSRALCEERLGHACTSLAYPYGDADARVIRATRTAGYLTAAALPGDFSTLDPLLWPRVGVYHKDDERRFRLKVSATMNRLRSNAVWDRALATRRSAIERRDTPPVLSDAAGADG